MLSIAAITVLPAATWQLSKEIVRRISRSAAPPDQKVDLHDIINQLETMERHSLKAA
jgi:hypothetical protein